MPEGQNNQSAQRLFLVLETLAESGIIGVTELSARTGLNKATAFRMLNTLVSMGYAKQDNRTQKYSLTFKLLGLAGQLLDTMDIRAAVHPHLEQLSVLAGETVHFVQREDTNIVYIDKVESEVNSIRMVSRIGLCHPMFCTGVGKAMLAEMSDTEIRSIWKRSPVQPLTTHTITDLDTLMREIAAIRARGYALDDEENELGVRCIAAAIRDYSGKANNAFSISAPVSRMTNERIQVLAEQVLQTKNIMTQEMGFRGR